MKPILIADDERAIADLIEMTLSPIGYPCHIANNGAVAADLLEKNEYELVLLDIMMPEVDGYELLEYIKPSGTPVIFITAKSSLSDKVKGLRFGADDYIVKPFEPSELLARVEAVLRRAGRGITTICAGDVKVDPVARIVAKADKLITLTPMEYDLLMVFVHNRGIVLYRDVLYERVWGQDSELDTRTLDIHIHRLRKKLGWETQIRTVPKIGYKLEI